MIESMNYEQFLVEINEKLCFADWHRRYYARCARIYHRIDYWMRCVLGILALTGAVMAGVPELRLLGACIAGGCAFIMANIIPIFNWDDTVDGFKAEEEEWTRIFKGYEDVISFAKISDRSEILVQEYQRVKEMQRSAALNARRLPEHRKLLDECDKETRGYYNLPDDPYKTTESKG